MGRYALSFAQGESSNNGIKFARFKARLQTELDCRFSAFAVQSGLRDKGLPAYLN